jgi:hypothetical protein
MRSDIGTPLYAGGIQEESQSVWTMMRLRFSLRPLNDVNDQDARNMLGRASA